MDDPLAIALSEQPMLFTFMTSTQVFVFMDLSELLRSQISMSQPSWAAATAPLTLPVSVQGFLEACLSHQTVRGVSSEGISYGWRALRKIIWQRPVHNNSIHMKREYLELFLRYGPTFKIGCARFYPPVRQCVMLDCVRNPANAPKSSTPQLDNPKEHPVTMFTQYYGALPAYTATLYCDVCHTTYAHDYYIHSNASLRTYYTAEGETPSVIQSSKHVFIEWRLCDYFSNQMALAWVSATNCAKIYNQTNSSHPKLDLDLGWPTPPKMTGDHVYDAFYLQALILDRRKYGGELTLENSGVMSQAERLQPVLEERNKRFQGPERPEWDHGCDSCSHKTTSSSDGINGWIRSMVTDGVTLGHPCCAVHECKSPLAGHRMRYCNIHIAMENKCSILSCSNSAQAGFKTCQQEECRALEDTYDIRKTAMFQLKRRLPNFDERFLDLNHSSGIAQSPPAASADTPPDDSGFMEQDKSSELSDEELMADETPNPPATQGVTQPPIAITTSTHILTSKPKVVLKSRSQFGRRRTHNEQLCVCSCGIIVGRTTFFGSEGIENVLQFWRELFPTKRSKPSFMWFDNNCSVMRVLASRPGDPLLQMRFPVNVFHFKCKHKETDEFCSSHCNPALFRHLKTPDNKWTFNSSVAEQTNMWFGRFQPIVRELRVDRFNFFLDQVILIHNENLLQDLTRKGKNTFNFGRETLLKE